MVLVRYVNNLIKLMECLRKWRRIMLKNDTHNFDVLVQISESELNKQLKAIFLSCDGGIPRGFDDLPIPGYLNFGIPSIQIVNSDGKIKIIIPISNSKLTLREVEEFGGRIIITHNIEVFNTHNLASIGLDFRSPNVDIEVKTDNDALDVFIPIFESMARNKLSSINQHGRIYFTQIPLGSYASDIFLPSNVDVTTVNSPEGNCLTVALQMIDEYSRAGEISQVNSYLITSDNSAAIIISSYWLLAHILRPELAQGLRVPLEQFDKPLKLNQPILLQGDSYDATLTSLEVNAIDEQLRVSGRITAHNPGPDIEVDFFIDITIEVDANGDLQPVAGDPQLSAFILIEPFVEDTIKTEINSALNSFTANSYSLGAIAEGFEISNVHIENNLVLNANVISEDIPEDTPHVSIKSSWTEAVGAPRFRFIGRHSQDVAWNGQFEALDCRAAFPLKYEWFFNDEALEIGENHQIATSDGTLTYDLDKRLLTLNTTRVGQAVDGNLCVKVVDGLNREFTDCINISKSGSVSRNDGRLNSKLPDIRQEWVNPPPIDGVWQDKVAPDFLEKVDPNVVGKLMAREGVTTLKDLRVRLNLTHAQMAKRIGLSQADYVQFESRKNLN